jgi:hypothetical protein
MLETTQIIYSSIVARKNDLLTRQDKIFGNILCVYIFIEYPKKLYKEGREKSIKKKSRKLS